MFKENQNFGIEKKELIIPEFEDPEELCITTFQGNRPAVSRDETPIATTGCALCSALLMRQGDVSVLFHVENSGLTVRQRESLKDLPKGSYVGKKIGNEVSNMVQDIIEMLKNEGDIIVDAEDVKVETGGGRYDVLYRPGENKIYVKIKGADSENIIEVEGLNLEKEKIDKSPKAIKDYAG
ncbi:MAG: hypothetical protein WC788_00590 [Candidatus Paceibacterota bacterium]|jgi:hypothetical protein